MFLNLIQLAIKIVIDNSYRKHHSYLPSVIVKVPVALMTTGQRTHFPVQGTFTIQTWHSRTFPGPPSDRPSTPQCRLLESTYQRLLENTRDY